MRFGLPTPICPAACVATCLSVRGEPLTSLDVDIDCAREEIETAPTTAKTYRERSVLMFL